MRNDDNAEDGIRAFEADSDWASLEVDNMGASISFLGPGILKVLDALPFYVLLVDKNHRILLANKATRDQLKMEPKELIGEYCPNAVHGIDEGTYPGCPLEEAVKTHQPVEREHFDENTGRWLRIAMYPTETWTVDGEEIYFHMMQDITEMKQKMLDLLDKLDQE
jgi:PAS domain S-box-containing protein